MNISARYLNASWREFTNFTSGISGDGFFSAYIAEQIVASMEEIIGMLNCCEKILLYLIFIPLLFLGCMPYGTRKNYCSNVDGNGNVAPLSNVTGRYLF